MKMRTLGLILLLAISLTTPAWSMGPDACTDDCSQGCDHPCSGACACCPCCQLPAAAAASVPEIRLTPSTVSTSVRPPAPLPSSEPRGVLHVPRPS